MSNKVDTRVVRMEFDNAQFEKKVKQTTKSLDNLNKSMDFSDAGKGLDNVKVKISALEVAAVAAISNITTKVVNLGITLTKSLSIDNIAAGWEKFGEKTIAVSTMLAQKIRIAGKEITDLAEKTRVVNEQLELLAWFSDETSYSFTDMVNNAGKFIATGQDLDTSVKAMEGIANWAAYAGQNAATASRAMYQLAQAMGKGKIQKLDWMSIQNYNMDIEEFRERALKAAVALGQLTKEGENFITKTGKKFTQSQFTDFLSEGWFTSDVLLKTLDEFSAAVEQVYEISQKTGLTASEVMEQYADQLDEFGLKALKASQQARTLSDVLNSIKDAVSTKWMQTFEYIIGKQEDAVKLWSNLADSLYDVFAESGNFRNNILSVWNSLSGRDDLFAKGTNGQGAFWNIYDGIKAVIDTIKGAWNIVFPLSEMESENDQAEDIARNLKSITKSIQQYTERLRNNTRVLDVLSRVSQIIFNTLKFGLNIIRLIRYALDPIFEVLKQLTGRIIDEVLYFIEKINTDGSKLENFFARIHDFLEEILINLDIKGILEGLFTIIEKVFSLVSKFFSLLSKLTPVIKVVLNGVISVVNWISKLPGLLNDAIKGWTGKDIIENISTFFDKIIDLFNGFNKKEEKTLRKSRMMAKKVSEVGEEEQGKEDAGILTPLQVLLNGIVTFAKGFLSMAKGALAGLGKSLEWIGNLFAVIGQNLNKVFTINEYSTASQKAMKMVAIMLLVLAAVLAIGTVLVNISWAVLGWANPIGNIADAMTDYAIAFKRNSLANMVKEVSNAILKFALAVALLGGINFESTIKTLIFVGALIGVMIGFLAFVSGEVKSLSVITEGFAAQVKNLKSGIVGAIEALKQVSLLGQFGYLLMTFGNLLIKLAIVAKTLETITWEDLSKTGAAVAAMVVSILLIGGLLGNKKNLDSIKNAYPGIFQMIAIVSIIHVLGRTMQQLVGIEWDKMWPALVAVASIMLLLTKMITVVGITNSINQSKKSLVNVLSIITVMGMLIGVIKIVTMSIMQLKDVNIGIIIAVMSGITAIIFSLSILLVTLSKIQIKSANPIKKAVRSIVIMAGSILSIAGALLMIGQLDNNQIASATKAILSILGAFAVFSILNAAMTKIFGKEDFAGSALAMALALGWFTAALIPFAGAMMMLGTVGWDGIASGLVAVAGSIAILGVSSMIFKKELPFMAVMSSVLLGFGAALIPFAGAMMMLGSIGWEGIKNSLLGVAGAILILGAAAIILKRTIPFMLAIASTMLIVGTAMLFAGLGMLTFVQGLLLLSQNAAPIMQSLINALKEFGPELFGELGISFMSFLTNLLAGIRKLIPQVVGLFKDLVAAVVDLLISSGPLLMDPLAYLFRGFLEALAENSLAIAGAVMQIILSVLEVLDANFYEISARVFSMLGQLMDAFADWIPTAIPIIVKMILNLLHGLVEELGPHIPEILALIVVFIGQIINGLATVIIPLAQMLGKVVLILLAVVIKIATESLGAVGTLFVNFVEAILMILFHVAMGLANVAYEMLKTIIVNLVILLNKALAFVGELMPKMLVSGFSAFIGGILKGFVDILDAYGFGWIADALGIRKASNAMLAASESMFDSIIASGQNVLDALEQANSNISNTVSSVVSNITGTVTDALNDIDEAVDTAADQISETMSDAGEQLGFDFGTGLSNGMSNSEDDVNQSGSDLADAAIEGTEEESETHSPSKAFMRIGEYFAEGLSLGIQNGKDAVIDNITKMIQSTIGIAEEIIANAEDEDITLVVGLDTTNVESQASRIQDIMSGISNPELSFYGRNAEYNAKSLNNSKNSDANAKGTTDNSTNVTYNNTFNVSSTDPEESAEEIDKKLKEQSLRARFAKGII